MSNTQVRIYSVPAISCGHCKSAIEAEVATVAGVESVDVDIGARTVRVEGSATDESVRSAIDDAGYEVAGVTDGTVWGGRADDRTGDAMAEVTADWLMWASIDAVRPTAVRAGGDGAGIAAAWRCVVTRGRSEVG